MALLNEAGIKTRETTVSEEDLATADELFSTGNLGKVLPITRYEDNDLQPGPVFAHARELYFAYAKGETV
jgi:branched-chain amino acid aminotransferase